MLGRVSYVRVAVFVILFLLIAVTPTLRAANWIDAPGYRHRELAVPASGRAHLTEVSSNETGITFRSDVADDRGAENSIRLAGTGVACGDVDGDGNCDLFFCSMGGRSVLYRNLGNWKFEDITSSAGVGCDGQDSTGAAFADVDGDGDLDLLINSIGGGTRLFLNDGHGHFSESLNSGLLRRNGSISMTLADVDGNGTLDLYVVNYAKTKIEDRPTTKFQTAKIGGKLAITAIDGVPITSPELTNRYYLDAGNTVRELGEADTLYLNDGHGKFTPVSWTGGFFLDKDGAPLPLPLYDWGLSAMFHDMNGDSLPDLYVCNDLFTPDRIWINDGHGHFRELPPLAMRQSSLFSMGVDFSDINRDGYDDFIVVDMLSPSLAEQKVQIVGVQSPRLTIGKYDDRPQYKRNTLFLNRGDNTYAEIGQLAGIAATGWSWSPVFLDVDLDGYDDLLVTAGYYRDALNADAINEMRNIRTSAHRALTKEEYREIKKLFPKLPQQNRAFRNQGDLTFQERGTDWGFADHGISQGICLADLDNDGDLDVVVVRQNAPVAIYKNESTAPRVAVRLKGNAPNTRGIGAKIKLLGAGAPENQEMICGGRYLCADDTIRTFAAPNGSKDLRLEVTWRNGTRSIVEGVRANRIYEIDEIGAQRQTVEKAFTPEPIFEDVSQLLNHTHAQTEFDDFQRQPSLAHKLSQSEPGITWATIDAEGRDSLFIGCASAGRIAMFQNRGGVFSNSSALLPDNLPQRDATTILALDKDRLIVGFSNYEDPKTNSVIELIDLPHRTAAEIASLPESIGPMALADLNGDGELDLFVGGRAIPGRYPEPANSFTFLGRGGKFEVDSQNTEALRHAGLVSGAVFSDLDGDGFPELILACEWGPVRVFHNDHGKLTDATNALGLSRLVGLWNGVTAGDFDGDGRMDIVASNFGRNTKYQTYRAKPRLYSGSGVIAKEAISLVASFDDYEQKWLPHCDYATAQKALRGLFPRYPTHKAYSAATIEELFEGEVTASAFVEASCLESTVFLNRGDHFEAHPLPIEAQFAPAFGISVADFDGDGIQDLFLAQNFFAVDGATARYDSGRGLLLKGRGDGTFVALSGDQSAIKLYGEQRGCAVGDYDGDGRIDLAVGQNGSSTALFHNIASKPGLRVHVRGRNGNPNGIGTLVRAVTAAGVGPAQELRAGSGYWSQDSSTLVVHASSPITALSIKSPGTAEKTYTVQPGATFLEIPAP